MNYKQLSILGAIENDSGSVSIADGAIETQTAKKQAIQRYLDRAKENIPHINTYSVRNTKNLYYRLSYRVKSKMKHIHICGGNTRSQLATYRVAKLQEMIDRGAELEEVIAAVRTFNGK